MNRRSFRFLPKSSRIWQRMIGLILLTSCIWGFLIAAPGRANIRLESRVNSLEYELRMVQAELSRLSSTARSQPMQPTQPLPSTSPSASGAYLSLDQQFDNLATLAIELREDLRALESRVAALEQGN
ncbi:MAG: hypothetical protein ACTS2F_10375 [Thainema sp.]